MTRARLRSLSALAVAGPLEHYEPDDPTNFGLEVKAFISDTDTDEVDAFNLVVCSPQWFAERFADLPTHHKGTGVPFALTAYRQLAGGLPAPWEHSDDPDWPLFGRGFLFMRHWNYLALWSTIADLCDRVTGRGWTEVARRIGEWIPWEDQPDDARSGHRLTAEG